MKKHALTLTASLVVVSTVVATSSCEQPPALCTTGRGDFAAVYTYKEGPPECGNLKSEILGLNTYSPEKDGLNSGSFADWTRTSFAIGSERIGWLIDRAARSKVEDATKTHKLYAIGDFPKEPTNQFCSTPQMRPPEAEIDMPAVPAIADDPATVDADESEPAVEATHYKYKWSNVNILVSAAALGTQMKADLEFTKNGCTAKYEVKAVASARNCESATTPGVPDEKRCAPYAQPDKGIFEGSGISPDFPVACVEFDPGSPGGAKRFFCMITKDVPAFN